MTPKTTKTLVKLIAFAVFCLTLVLASEGFAADQVFGNFETGFDGWTIAWDGTTDLGNSTNGATLDTQSMSILPDDSDFWKLQREGTLNLAGAARIAMDITFIASEWPAGAWCNISKIALMDHSIWNWQEIQESDMAVEGISGAVPPSPDGSGHVAYWGPWMGDATWTVSWRLTNITNPSNDFYSMFMAMQCSIDKSVAGHFYIDNVRVLSEDLPDPPTRLHVEGNKLINEDGNEIILRGVSLIDVGFLQDWQGGATNMINRLTNRTDTSCDSVGWRTNVIRIPVIPPDKVSFPHPFDPNNTDLYDLIRSVVDYCALKGIYAIIDWHEVDNTYDNRMPGAIEFWTYMAPRFADDEHVMFELYNEPINWVGTTDEDKWDSVKADMETLVDTVRTYAPHTLLFVGTPQYCQIIGPTVDNPIDDPNIVYVSHIYPWHWINETFYHTVNLTAASEAHPVVIGEWGFLSDGSGGTLDGTITNYGQPLREFIEGLGISNIAWVSSFDWQPPMYDANWTLLEGNGCMGCFVKDWIYNGWIATQNTTIPLTFNRCVVTAGTRRGRDSFEASGTFATVPPNLYGVDQIDVNIASVSDGNVIYREDVNFIWDMDGSRFIRSTRTTGQITTLILNFSRKTFIMKAQNINLQGLGAPLRLDFTLDDYMLSGEVNEAIINTTKCIPVVLMSGYKNTLYTTLVKDTNSTTSLKDSLGATGKITVRDINIINLANETVVFTWSDANETSVQTFTVPVGKFRRSGTSHSFSCSGALTTEGARVTATINLDACTFTATIYNTNLSVTDGDAKFSISFADFDETNNLTAAAVTRPTSVRNFQP